jgi:hypothetical protein
MELRMKCVAFDIDPYGIQHCYYLPRELELCDQILPLEEIINDDTLDPYLLHERLMKDL